MLSFRPSDNCGSKVPHHPLSKAPKWRNRQLALRVFTRQSTPAILSRDPQADPQEPVEYPEPSTAPQSSGGSDKGMATGVMGWDHAGCQHTPRQEVCGLSSPMKETERAGKERIHVFSRISSDRNCSSACDRPASYRTPVYPSRWPNFAQPQCGIVKGVGSVLRSKRGSNATVGYVAPCLWQNLPVVWSCFFETGVD